MKISGYYTFTKKVITYTILILTFLLDGLTTIVYMNTNNFCFTGFLADLQFYFPLYLAIYTKSVITVCQMMIMLFTKNIYRTIINFKNTFKYECVFSMYCNYLLYIINPHCSHSINYSNYRYPYISEYSFPH